jgi:sugar lactone lactonase YvrE
MKLKLFFKCELNLFSRLVGVYKIGSSTADSITIIICILNLIEVPYNQPKFPPYACWNPDGIIFASKSMAVIAPSSLFVDRNNTVYVADYSYKRVRVWGGGSTTVTKIISNTLPQSYSLFVNIDGNIYISSISVKTVEKWALNATKSVVVMRASSNCHELFVDISHNLYCSLRLEHRVVKQSLDVGTTMLNTVAGNGSQGSASHMLAGPRGIFVDINFTLYVADCENHRVQLFKFGQLDGITVAGEGATLSVTLGCPTAVFLDADNNLFIVDSRNHRIIGSTSNGFYCLAGCSGVPGVALNQLKYPVAAAFDSYGNIFVTESNSNQIQKFIHMTDGLGKWAES